MLKKQCQYCGRVITYRKKWEKNWSEIKYFSDRCRGNARKNRTSALELEEKILAILAERGAEKTICPSEILENHHKQDREKMEEVRQAARRLVHAGKIEILQKGKVVEPSAFRGPIRLRKK